jgi:hypothetical protein
MSKLERLNNARNLGFPLQLYLLVFVEYVEYSHKHLNNI